MGQTERQGIHRCIEQCSSNAQASCSEQCMFSNARTYARTHEELLTLRGNLALVDARRGVARSDASSEEVTEPAVLVALDLPAIVEPPAGRFPVHRTRHTDRRQPIPVDARIYVYQRDHHACVRCGSPDRLTLDHITPWSALGSDHVDNLRTLCWTCNQQRSNRHQPDDDWRPLPQTFCCVDCIADLVRIWPDEPTAPLDHPSMTRCFCWWHRHAAIGARSLWFSENNAHWDYDLNWHRNNPSHPRTEIPE
ncbi:HNH endonuclease [Mycobacteroides abscessus subsp. abscessus]|nr:HNH endonuclease [Mycobacteroides abscessus subsp. abscessus]SHU45745.1 HNH endonuclease [Mycobacteroides abscessus subsp. abscessus]SIK02117.1 HNH endonuclease [Mycobacteroides abscessus subsp. abscessus]